VRVALLSLGCKVNQAEIAEMERELRGRGHSVVGLGEGPEVCVVNTCTVTGKSDYQSRQLIRRAQKAGARVVATGCYASLHPEKVGRMEGVEQVVGNAEKDLLIGVIDTSSECITSDKWPGSSGRSRYFLKVQDGCDYACSYCLITKARGRSRSVSVDDVVSRVQDAVAEGYREIVLTGVHLGLYGRDVADGRSLAGLVEEILAKTDAYRLRFGSLQVNELDDRLVALLGDGRVCRHLHVPLQSGDNGVLELMRRGYRTEEFRPRVEYIWERYPGISIGTDVITGFPHEGAEAFENTCRLVEDLPFSYLHVFPYSRRPGTDAAELPDTVGREERERRAGVLRELSREKAEAYRKAQMGRTLDVIAEEPDEDGWRGTSGNYLKVRIVGDDVERGGAVRVRVEGVEGDVLVGDVVDGR
jgi:threonylcarbamoyladenosine tRNA methylthiotransferase MtaB